MEVHTLKTIVYENGREFLSVDMYTSDELDEMALEIEKLFTGNNLVVKYYSCDCDGDSTFHVEKWNPETQEASPIPDEWLKKIVTFGHPKKEKNLRLVGDRIPIMVTGHPSLQLKFVNSAEFE